MLSKMAGPLPDLRELCVISVDRRGRWFICVPSMEFSLQVPAQTSLGIVGESGSGKAGDLRCRSAAHPPGRIDGGL